MVHDIVQSPQGHLRLIYGYLESEASVMAPAAEELLAGFRVLTDEESSSSGTAPTPIDSAEETARAITATRPASRARDRRPTRMLMAEGRRRLKEGGISNSEPLWRQVVKDFEAGFGPADEKPLLQAAGVLAAGRRAQGDREGEARIAQRVAEVLEHADWAKPETRSRAMQEAAELAEARHDWAAAQLHWKRCLDFVLGLGPSFRTQADILLTRLLLAAQRAGGDKERRRLEGIYGPKTGRTRPKTGGGQPRSR